MTDRFNGLVVTFDRDIRDDDAQPIIEAIKMIKGVISVTPNVVDHTDWMNRERVKMELKEKLWEALK